MIEERNHQGRGKGVWSQAGVIRGSDQVDRVCSHMFRGRGWVIKVGGGVKDT